jgi:hypothetical protein
MLMRTPENNPLILVDKNGEIAFVPLIFIGIQLYGTYSLGYHGGEVLNAGLLFNDRCSAPERNDAHFYFGFDLLTSVAGMGLVDELGKAFLTLSSDILSGLERLDKAGDERKRRYDQSRTLTNVKLTRSGPSVGGSAGGSQQVYPSSSYNGGDNGRSRAGGNGGGSGLSSSQFGALQNFGTIVNAKSFDAAAFVTALRAVVTAFNVK